MYMRKLEIRECVPTDEVRRGSPGDPCVVIGVYIYTHISMYIYMGVRIYIRIYLYICIYIKCTYVYTCIYIYLIQKPESAGPQTKKRQSCETLHVC